MPRRSQADNKTHEIAPGQPGGDVDAFLAALSHAGRREDAYTLLALMERITGAPARMWGPSIVGFGEYHYVYESGREGDSMLTGFAPRKANMVLYVMPGFAEYEAQLARLGKYRTGKSCLYLGRLSGIDLDVLEDIIADSVAHMRRKYDVA